MHDEHPDETALILRSLCELRDRAEEREMEFLGLLLQAAIVETALWGESLDRIDKPDTGVDVLLGVKLRIMLARRKTNIVAFPTRPVPDEDSDGGS